MATPLHRFRTGERIELVAGKMDGNLPRGLFTVLRPLPNDQMDREYRVRHTQDGHERVVRESQMRADPFGKQLP